jgi:hypothetical protein
MALILSLSIEHHLHLLLDQKNLMKVWMSKSVFLLFLLTKQNFLLEVTENYLELNMTALIINSTIPIQIVFLAISNVMPAFLKQIAVIAKLKT